MSEWMPWVAFVAVGTVLLTWALHREFARLEREAARRQAAALDDIGRAALRVSIVLRDEFTPAMQRVAKAVAQLATRHAPPPTGTGAAGEAGGE